MKKIAFVATGYIVKYDGISVYTENLLINFLSNIQKDNLDFEVDIYVGHTALELLKQRVLQENFDVNINFISVKDDNFAKKILTLNYMLIKNGSYNLIFMTNFMPTVFLTSKTLKVIHDFSVNNFSELYSKSYLKYHNMLLKYAKLFDNGIGYISQTTKADLKKYHDIDESNKKLLHVQNGIPFKVKNYERPSDESAKEKYLSKDLEFLVVGRINKHKGFDRILKFFEYFDNSQKQDNFNQITLNIVGKQTSETTQIFKDLKLKNINLKFHGFLNDEQLNSLYSKAHFCLFLSRNEGYGIPLVEAMWFKSIPIISNIPIFNEIMGEEYPKFDDKSGYEEAIGNFVLNIFEDNNFREKQKNHLEQIVNNEIEGYNKASKNLINFIKGM